jgi:glycosyltransferase involved in cell wall biosynthesis
MTILMTADAVGGVWTYALDLARALPQHRWVLATMGPTPSDDQLQEVELLSAQADITLRSSTCALEWQPDPWREVDEAGGWLLDLEDEFAPDLIHLNGYTHGALPFRAPKLVVAHSCVPSWWRAVHSEEAPGEWDEYRDRVRSGLRAADFVAAPTQAMLREAEHLYGPLPQPPRSRQVLANGRTLDFEPPAPPKEPFVFAAGRLWDGAKNIALLEQAAPMLHWPVRVAGGEGQSGPNIEFLGRLKSEEVLDLMRRAGIYALPARYEPFGLSALEAALAGCALVLGDIPTLREVWGDAALFVAPDNADALARTLNDLAGDGAWRDEMAQRAVRRAQRFSIEQFGRGYERVYEQILQAQDASRARQVLAR